ncbi:hypothetical protein HGRIS_006126 [Hohenbuehelia grisea]|uniref:SET domain-containing protein n=1 Tax=Hohenbuehelia grisea TaxID=104357 RepID=A0ABR3K029_9AGAR
MSTLLLNGFPSLRLESHLEARNKAVAARNISAGAVVLSTPGFATVLLPSEKGRRCDACHLPGGGQRQAILRCSGCASYFYCDSSCQKLHWPKHKLICKRWNSFATSPAFQSLEEHEKMDAILLTHTLAELSVLHQTGGSQAHFDTLMELLPSENSSQHPPVCPNAYPSCLEAQIQDIYSRFGNNNFAVHSHLNTFAHGVFPLASRTFNHSCAPNAAAKYILNASHVVVMEVVALRDITLGEEVCLTYLDPALMQSRHQMLEITYGFRCRCQSCQTLNSMDATTLPIDASDLGALEASLRKFVGIGTGAIPSAPSQAIPRELYCLFSEAYLGQLSETFSKASHEGSYEVAQQSGETLLALYIMIYPPNYPQIGMHALEITKSRWNAAVVGDTKDTLYIKTTQYYLALSRAILDIFGQEGDPDGPRQEISLLESLINETLIQEWSVNI